MAAREERNAHEKMQKIPSTWNYIVKSQELIDYLSIIHYNGGNEFKDDSQEKMIRMEDNINQLNSKHPEYANLSPCERIKIILYCIDNTPQLRKIYGRNNRNRTKNGNIEDTNAWKSLALTSSRSIKPWG